MEQLVRHEVTRKSLVSGIPPKFKSFQCPFSALGCVRWYQTFAKFSQFLLVDKLGEAFGRGRGSTAAASASVRAAASVRGDHFLVGGDFGHSANGILLLALAAELVHSEAERRERTSLIHRFCWVLALKVH